MTDTNNTPNTYEEWRAKLAKARLTWYDARKDAEDAEDTVKAIYEDFVAWREHPQRVAEAWEPWCARLTRELGIDFAVTGTGGGLQAISGQCGFVRMLITDWRDGDLSHPEAGTGWWIGFSLPDAPWSGITESILGDPAARTYDDLAKMVSFAIADFMRGGRHEPHADQAKVVDYGVW